MRSPRRVRARRRHSADHLSTAPSAEANPYFWVPALLLVPIGPLFFVVSAPAPLIQRWYALAGAGDPPPLAASNLGALPACSPIRCWSSRCCRSALSAGYGPAAIARSRCLSPGVVLDLPRRGADAQPRDKVSSLPRRLIAKWILLAAVPSGLILSTTLYLTTDLVAVPLLWVIPLGAYLLSFTVAFASRRWPAAAIRRTAPFILLLSAATLFAGRRDSPRFCRARRAQPLHFIGRASQPAVRLPTRAQSPDCFLSHDVGRRRSRRCVLRPRRSAAVRLDRAPAADAGSRGGADGRPPLLPPWPPLWDSGEKARRLTAIGIALVVLMSIAELGLFGLPRSPAAGDFAVVVIIAVAVPAIGNRPCSSQPSRR